MYVTFVGVIPSRFYPVDSPYAMWTTEHVVTYLYVDEMRHV